MRAGRYPIRHPGVGRDPSRPWIPPFSGMVRREMRRLDRTKPFGFDTLEPHCLCLDHIGQAAYGVDQPGRQLLVDLDERDRVLARRRAPEMERRDIDRGRPERVAERADKA